MGERKLKTLALVLLVAGSGCGPRLDTSTTKNPVATTSHTVAQINGTLITEADIEREAALQKIIQPGETLDNKQQDHQRILDELIDQRLLAQEAIKRGLDKDLEARTRLRIARERILGNILVERVVADAVTNETIQRLFDEQAKVSEPSIEVRARHILVDNKKEAEDVRAALSAGAEFATVVLERSKDAATRLKGGDLGYFTRDSMLKPFADIAFGLTDGEISEPVETRYGWHIIQMEGRRKSQPATLEEMRPRLVRFMTFDEIQKLVTGLRKSAKIEHTESAILELQAE